MVACPFGAMQVRLVGSRAQALKCDLCVQREGGPACVEACQPTRCAALILPVFGLKGLLHFIEIPRKRQTVAPVSVATVCRNIPDGSCRLNRDAIVAGIAYHHAGRH